MRFYLNIRIPLNLLGVYQKEVILNAKNSLVTQTVKKPPTMWETWVRCLDWEGPLENGTATHSNILSWRILWIEEPDRIQSMGSQSDTTE